MFITMNNSCQAPFSHRKVKPRSSASKDNGYEPLPQLVPKMDLKPAVSFEEYFGVAPRSPSFPSSIVGKAKSEKSGWKPKPAHIPGMKRPITLQQKSEEDFQKILVLLGRKSAKPGELARVGKPTSEPVKVGRSILKTRKEVDQPSKSETTKVTVKFTVEAELEEGEKFSIPTSSIRDIEAEVQRSVYDDHGTSQQAKPNPEFEVLTNTGEGIHVEIMVRRIAVANADNQPKPPKRRVTFRDYVEIFPNEEEEARLGAEIKRSFALERNQKRKLYIEQLEAEAQALEAEEKRMETLIFQRQAEKDQCPSTAKMAETGPLLSVEELDAEIEKLEAEDEEARYAKIAKSDLQELIPPPASDGEPKLGEIPKVKESCLNSGTTTESEAEKAQRPPDLKVTESVPPLSIEELDAEIEKLEAEEEARYAEIARSKLCEPIPPLASDGEPKMEAVSKVTESCRNSAKPTKSEAEKQEPKCIGMKRPLLLSGPPEVVWPLYQRYLPRQFLPRSKLRFAFHEGSRIPQRIQAGINRIKVHQQYVASKLEEMATKSGMKTKPKIENELQKFLKHIASNRKNPEVELSKKSSEDLLASIKRIESEKKGNEWIQKPRVGSTTLVPNKELYQCQWKKAYRKKTVRKVSN